MAAHSKIWYLERFRLTQVLTDAQKRRVRAAARMLEITRGERIYLHGDPASHVFLLKAGVVRISSNGGQGETILALLHPGDIFGELAVFEEAPHSHSATAHEDVVLCTIQRELLVQLIHETPALGYQITKMMGAKLRRLQLRMEELLFRSAHARVARALLDMAEDCGIKDADGVIIPVRLNQRDLGNLVGLARETVNLVLRDLRQQGLVEAQRQRIRIRNPSGLAVVS